jgi:hypothetical protein
VIPYKKKKIKNLQPGLIPSLCSYPAVLIFLPTTAPCFLSTQRSGRLVLIPPVRETSSLILPSAARCGSLWPPILRTPPLYSIFSSSSAIFFCSASSSSPSPTLRSLSWFPARRSLSLSLFISHALNFLASTFWPCERSRPRQPTRGRAEARAMGLDVHVPGRFQLQRVVLHSRRVLASELLPSPCSLPSSPAFLPLPGGRAWPLRPAAARRHLAARRPRATSPMAATPAPFAARRVAPFAVESRYPSRSPMLSASAYVLSRQFASISW